MVLNAIHLQISTARENVKIVKTVEIGKGEEARGHQILPTDEVLGQLFSQLLPSLHTRKQDSNLG